ncbi:uncharacterized protein LOC135384360 [Ornithodoros turicata]|uniref:uncharacterized protein LOC135384360 n=1 Tax=Ornithodoros turicata TaxID=34597 RepID=UPI003138E7E3
MGGCSTTKGYRMFRVPWNVESRKRWAAAIGRLGRDGKLWMPSTNSRLCSEHFVHGCSSHDPGNVDYVPSVFRHSQKLSEKCDKKIESYKRRSRVAQKLANPLAFEASSSSTTEECVTSENDVEDMETDAMPPSLPNSNVLDAEVQTVSCGTLCTSCNILHTKVDTLTQRIQELEGANKELSAQLAEQHNVKYETI